VDGGIEVLSFRIDTVDAEALQLREKLAADELDALQEGLRRRSAVGRLDRPIEIVENLEQIGLSFPGVEKCFAVQAGRELRVMVQPDKINDEQAYQLARSIVRKIEDELQYPGQIRVTVVRETRCVELAK
jgi:ribonuclease Y